MPHVGWLVSHVACRTWEMQLNGPQIFAQPLTRLIQCPTLDEWYCCLSAQGDPGVDTEQKSYLSTEVVSC